jgi:hypothetical protein
VQQTQSDLATAQANYQLAQITADRWQKLLLKNPVSKQESDQASSDLDARRSALSAQEANVRRLRQLQGFEKIYGLSMASSRQKCHIGDLIQVEENTTPHELSHLSSVDRLRVFVPVPEIYQSVLHSVRQVNVSPDAYPKERFMGIIARNSDAIESFSRTLRVEWTLTMRRRSCFREPMYLRICQCRPPLRHPDSLECVALSSGSLRVDVGWACPTRPH